MVINTLSNLFPPNGQNVGEIANTVLAGVLITPANYAFAIWGLIYLGLIAYGIYQFSPDRRDQPQIQRTNQLLIVACVAQIIWIFLFTLEQFGWSILAMLGILLPLMGIYLTLDIGRGRVSRQRRWQAHIPFSLYLGWIAVATIVNVASALYAANWTGWGLSPIAWTVIMVVVAALVAALVMATRRDVAYTLVAVWALVAIALRHNTIAAIWVTSAVAAAILAVWVVWSLATFTQQRSFS
ncbi:tryptophan-rich sensory protein [Nodosilinea sp. P-1105]|nr:tryptophan-rich sensory protein [Nodosilinea sp. P-1105]